MSFEQKDIERHYLSFMKAYAKEILDSGDPLFVPARDFRAIALHFANLGADLSRLKPERRRVGDLEFMKEMGWLDGQHT